jgi:hypothetical protein
MQLLSGEGCLNDPRHYGSEQLCPPMSGGTAMPLELMEKESGSGNARIHSYSKDIPNLGSYLVPETDNLQWLHCIPATPKAGRMTPLFPTAQEDLALPQKTNGFSQLHGCNETLRDHRAAPRGKYPRPRFGPRYVAPARAARARNGRGGFSSSHTLTHTDFGHWQANRDARTEGGGLRTP